MPRPTLPVSLITGTMTWTPGATPSAEILASGSNLPGRAPKNGMKSRSGLFEPEQAIRPKIDVATLSLKAFHDNLMQQHAETNGIGDPGSEQRRVGNECVSTGSFRWSPYHLNKNTKNKN